ncbi:MAG: GNAT family N-acetyltransferase [Candidatus Heimdallarchaeota archaeon]|nr:GNAT family N-acetyltransferase [Candidatus Heimdallarchaeota archaeon]
MEISVKPAKLEDVPAIRQFFNVEYDYNRNDPEKATPDFFGLREDAIVDMMNSLHAIVQDKEVLFLLVKDTKRKHILGWGQVVRYENNTAEMSSLYLTEIARNKNVGTKTLKVVKKACRERGFKNMFTLIQSSNVGAKRFLINHGFEKVESFELDSDLFIDELRPLKVDKLIIACNK